MTKNNTTIERTWPEARQYKKSIRLEFSLYVSGIILVLMVVTGFVITDEYVKKVTENVVDKLLVQARSYSGPAGKLIISAEAPDALFLNNICKKLSDDNSDVFWSGITGQDNVFLAHTDIKQVIASATMQPVKGHEFGDILRSGEAFDQSLDTLHIVVPIVENGLTVGHLKVAASTRQIAEARRQSITTVASITVFMILLGIPLTMALLHFKLRPVTVITDRLKNVSLDDFSLDIPVNTRNEFGYLAETLRVMGSKLGRAQKELIEKDRIARELEIAHEIQANILPREFPEHPQVEIAVDYRSAREVGGDYYDFIEIDPEHLAFLVADVSGKSLPGMLVMLLTRDIVRRLMRTTTDPADLLRQVNRELIPNIKRGMFVTMFVGVINMRTGVFTYASAGHNPLIRLSAFREGAQLAKTRGFPLGMMEPHLFDARIEKGAVRLTEGEWLIQYTDGINEARNTDEEEFGMERFIAQLQASSQATSSELVRDVIARHTEFVGGAAQFDDITLLAVKWKGLKVDKDDTGLLSEMHLSHKE